MQIDSVDAPAPMVREERYIIIKRKDLVAASGDSHGGVSEAEAALRNHLDSWQVGTREGLVVERDWPEYEPVWQMIEARVTGSSQSSKLPTANAWVRCSDKLPGLAIGDNECSDNVLAFEVDLGARILQAFYSYDDELWYDQGGDQLDGEVTHWMPMPNAPVA